VRAILLAALLALAACQHKESTLGGTVVEVAEAALAEEPADDAGKSYEPPMVPEVAWKVDVQLDDGSTVSVLHSGPRRYEPGERVRMILDSDGELLL
jgi:hypothetical protein